MTLHLITETIGVIYVCMCVCVCVYYMYLPVLVIDTIVVEVIGPRDVFEDSIVGQIKGFASSNFMELSIITILNIIICH